MLSIIATPPCTECYSSSKGYSPAVCRLYPFIHLGEERQSAVKFLVYGKQRDGRGLSPGPPDGQSYIRSATHSSMMLTIVMKCLARSPHSPQGILITFIKLMASVVYTGPDKFLNGRFFCMCNLFTRNHRNSVTDCRTV